MTPVVVIAVFDITVKFSAEPRLTVDGPLANSVPKLKELKTKTRVNTFIIFFIFFIFFIKII